MPAFIIADQGEIVPRIREVLKFAGFECPASSVLKTDVATSRLRQESSIDLAVLALTPDPAVGLELLPPLARLAPGKILVVGPSDNSRLLLHALRAGAVDYVDSTDLEADLEAAIRRINDAARAPTASGRLIAVLSPSGGGGASTVAANLSVSLAREHKSVGLLDLRSETGDQSSLLDLKPTYTLVDLCQNSARLDRVMFERTLVKHDSGVSLVAAPFQMADAPRIKPDCVSQVLGLARASFPVLVADLAGTYREEQLVVLRQADAILIVFRLDFCSLRNVRRTLEFLEGTVPDLDRVQLVVNRSGQPQEVPAGKAEEALGRKVAHHIPEDAKVVNRAINHGVPFVIEAPSAKVSKAIVKLATSLSGRLKA